jgi:hypothetical protein
MKRPSNLVSLVLAVLSACASPAAVMGADDPQATKAVAGDATKKPPMIIHNPDGTFTVQKAPSREQAKDPKAKKGMVIPPQVVVPLMPARERRK